MTSIILNTADQQQDGLIPDFTSSGIGSLQEFFNQDKSIAVFVQPVVPSASGAFPWEADYDADDIIYFQIGEENAKATGGTFDLTYGASTAAELAYNITAAALETAIEGLGAAVSVTSLSEGVYLVQWDDVGAVATLFSSDADLLQPACEIIVAVTNVGSASEKEQRVIEIRQAPVVSATIDTVYAPTGVSVTQKTANSGTQNAIYEVNLGDAYAGEYTVSVVADGVTTIVVLDASMESDAIGGALAAHPSIYYQDVTEPDNITVSKSGALITVTFLGTLGGTSSVRTITANTVANPTVITCAGHKLKTGDSIVISGSDSTPTIDGTRTVTVISENSFSVPVNVTVDGTTGSFYATTQPAIAYGSDLSLKTPKGFTGTINLNTVALAKAFWATDSDELTYPAQFKRVRATGEQRTIYGADVTLKRPLVNTSSLIPVPALPFVGQGVQLFANAAARAAATPLAVGQIGFQLDDTSLWNGTDTAAGAWVSSFAIQSPSVGIPNVAQGEFSILGESGTYAAFFDSTEIVGSNKTYTLPNASGAVVLDTATQTLTNKTLSGATNTITNVSLTTGITGTLPIANGGTGVTSMPCFAAYCSSTTTLTTGGATKVNFATEDFDIASNYNPATSRFTAPIAGKYRFNTRVTVNGSLGPNAEVFFAKNGTKAKSVYYNIVDPASVHTIDGSAVIVLVANDYVEVFAYNDAGSSRTVQAFQAYSQFAGEFITS